MNETPAPVVRNTSIEACHAIAPHLREADRETLQRITGLPAASGLAAIFDMSTSVYTVNHEGRTVALLGVTPLGDGVGSPWLACTGEMEAQLPGLQTNLSGIVEDMHRAYGTLASLVDPADPLLPALLASCGFTVSAHMAPAIPRGAALRLHWRRH